MIAKEVCCRTPKKEVHHYDTKSRTAIKIKLECGRAVSVMLKGDGLKPIWLVRDKSGQWLVPINWINAEQLAWCIRGIEKRESQRMPIIEFSRFR